MMKQLHDIKFELSRYLIIIFLSFLFYLLLVFALSSCDKESDSPSKTSHTYEVSVKPWQQTLYFDC